MYSDEEQQIRLQFLDEAEEYLSNIESQLVGIANHPLSIDKLETIRRSFHSIKGGAGMMNFRTLSNLTHQLEDCFDSLHPGDEYIQIETEQLLLGIVDCLGNCIEEYRKGIEKINIEWLEEIVKPLLDQAKSQLGVHSSSPKSRNTPMSEEDMKVIVFETEVENCLRRLESLINREEDKACIKSELKLASEELGGLGEMLELPEFQSLCALSQQKIAETPPENIDAIASRVIKKWRESQSLIIQKQFSQLPTNLDLDSDVTEIVSLELVETISENKLKNISQITEIVPNNQLEVKSLSTHLITQKPQPESDNISNPQLRVSAAKLDQIEELLGELAIERNGLNLQLQQLSSLVELLKTRVNVLDSSYHFLQNLDDSSPKEMVSATNSSKPNLGLNNWDALEVDKYINIHPLFQDLIEVIVQIQEVTRDLEINLNLTQKAAKGISRTSSAAQKNCIELRLRPFSDVVKLFPRAIREMSIKYQKPVNLVIQGESTLIDRTILNTIKDPLVHLVRNAFDHGIETQKERIALGKPEIGTIEIAATQKGDLIMITVKDDGRGINLAKIREKVPEENLTQDQLLDLIFKPGFSTASKITELSGRGLGMDIVRRQLQQVRGDIKVSTELNQGTTLTILVPYTLSIVKVLLVESGKMLMAVPINLVKEMIVISSEVIIETSGQKSINWDGEKIPLLSLKQWLNFNRIVPKSPPNKYPMINQPIALIINQRHSLFALEMDSYWGEQEVTIRSFELVLPMPPGLTGCTILGDGRVVPLADPIALINWLENHQLLELKASRE